jgi:hypothetical protein
MADDTQNDASVEEPSTDGGGLDEITGQIEEDATKQISGDALEQIRESAGQDMAPEWLEKMRRRKRESEQREAEDFDTPVPDGDGGQPVPKTEQMDPDDVGSLTEGMGLADEPSPAIAEQSPDGDTTEIERDSTKAINRGELDTLMKEKEAELREQSADSASDASTPKAGVISKTSRAKSERQTRDVDDEAEAAVHEVATAEQHTTEQETSKSSSSFSLPRPSKKPQKTEDDPPTRPIDDGLDDDSFGDLTDDDMHAVVFGDEDADAPSPQRREQAQQEQAQQEQAQRQETRPRDEASKTGGAVESPSLDFSDIAAEQEQEDHTPVEQADEPPSMDEEPSPVAAESDAPDLEEPPEVDAESGEPTFDEGATTPAQTKQAPREEPARAEPSDAPGDELSDDLAVEPPDDFPDYETEPQRPVLAALAGFLAALVWVVGGVLAMFTSLSSPWQSLVPPMCLGGGVVAFLLVMIGPPKWIESSILAVLGIGIGGFAFVQWSGLGTIDITDYLGMAPLVGAGLAIFAAVATLVRPSGAIQEF